MKMKLSFGEKVRNLREDKDLNQTQLGKAVGMTQRKLSYIECGKYEPSIGDIIAFCNFFKVVRFEFVCINFVNIEEKFTHFYIFFKNFI